jgi:hypothetical protein
MATFPTYIGIGIPVNLKCGIHRYVYPYFIEDTVKITWYKRRHRYISFVIVGTSNYLTVNYCDHNLLVSRHGTFCMIVTINLINELNFRMPYTYVIAK